MLSLLVSRLNLTPKSPQSPFREPTPPEASSPGAKKPRIEEPSPTSTTTIDAEGAVQVALADAGGRYVKVANVGDVVRLQMVCGREMV